MPICQPSPRRRRASTIAGRRASAAALPLLLALGLTATALAGCGSSSPSASQTSTSASGVAGAKASVHTTTVAGYGTVLAGPSGSPLYLLTADPRGGSSCSGACAKQWLPLTLSGKGKPTGGSGVSASLLSSFTRGDGSVQVLYNGHALYTHPGMSASAVAGTASDGGIWYLVSPSGKPVKTTNGSGY